VPHRIRAAELRDAIHTHPGSTEAFNEVLGTTVRTDELGWPAPAPD
jgi:hypothetical protein